jgi:hypothetical protein
MSAVYQKRANLNSIGYQVLYPSLRVGRIGRKGKKKAEEASSGKVEYSQNLPHKESTAS